MGVAAAIRNSDGAYLLHLRDDIPGICWPGHWSFLGGQLEAGETPTRPSPANSRKKPVSSCPACAPWPRCSRATAELTSRSSPPPGTATPPASR
ncbi:hypothetical protein [Streptomyces sp. Ac-502]|uniref:hypothetical protein n=1 Tax=Streptomyces sp. Ac-502 TaxID=3342801 RepID=UPI0038629E38